MKNNLTYIYIILIFLNFSCKKTNEKASKEVKITLNNVQDKLVLNNKNNEYIFLENTKNSLIGTIDKIIATDNYLYILDRETTKSIFIFDHKGRYVAKIDNQGRGPGEYIMPDDFLVDPKTEEIIILDVDQRKVLFFKENKFIKEKRTKKGFLFMSYVGDKIVGLNGSCYKDNDCHKIYIFDKDFNFEKSIVPIEKDEKTITWILEKPLFEYNSSLYITDPFSNTISKIDNNLNYSSDLTIDFGDEGINPEEKSKKRDEFLKFLSKTKKAYLIDDYMLNDKLMYFNFYYNSFLTHCLYLKDKSNIYICVTAISDQDNLYMAPVFTFKKHMFFKSSAREFLFRHKNSNILPENFSELSNPVLIKTSINSIVDAIKN